MILFICMIFRRETLLNIYDKYPKSKKTEFTYFINLLYIIYDSQHTVVLIITFKVQSGRITHLRTGVTLAAW